MARKCCSSSAHITVRKGEQYFRFVLNNDGTKSHEFVLATVAENRKHVELMKKYPHMEHDDPNAKRLTPFTEGEIVWKFTRRGTFEFALPDPWAPRSGDARHDRRKVNTGSVGTESVMKKTILMLAFALSLATASYASAQSLTDGVVTKIDVSAAKITIKHGPMEKFDMDEGMTMVYRAQDPAMLQAVKAGDNIKFDAENINGQFVVTKIQKEK